MTLSAAAAGAPVEKEGWFAIEVADGLPVDAVTAANIEPADLRGFDGRKERIGHEHSGR